MKHIIAYCEDGKNKWFETMEEARTYYGISQTVVRNRLRTGNPVMDPVSMEDCYLDELEKDEVEVAE